MDIFKITALGIFSAVLCVFIKNIRPEISILLSLSGAMVILFFILPSLRDISDALKGLADAVGLDEMYLFPVLKVVGISYITEIGGALCKDAGEEAIASKINLAGKIIIVSLALPVAYKMISIIDGIIFSF